MIVGLHPTHNNVESFCVCTAFLDCNVLGTYARESHAMCIEVVTFCRNLVYDLIRKRAGAHM